MSAIRSIRPLLFTLFFLSGVAGLIYQIVWTRMLVLVFGNTMLAASTVLSAFMAGLAAGSYALGRLIDRRPRRLVALYAALEAGIGIFALVFPFLLASATPLYAALYRALEGDVGLLNLARFAVCFVLIGIPTFLMGGTLPVLLKRFAGEEGRLGAQTGLLYGLNTAGAVLGTLACGYFLLRLLGMQATTWVAVALNLGIAGAAWILARSGGDAAADVEDPGRVVPDGAPGVPTEAPATVRAVLVAIGVSGFCALAYEVFWTRMLNLFLNNTIYSFTAILATFLVGIAVGSLVYSRFLSHRRDQVPLFAALQVGIGLLAYATPFLFQLLHGTLFVDLAEGLNLAKTAVIMFPPTILMGIAVPMAVHICQRGRHREGTTVGTVYAVNTVGAILGAFAAGFVLLPLLGLQAGVILLASLNVVAGVLPVMARVPRRRRLAWAGAAAAVVAAFALLAPAHLFRDLFARSHPSADLLHYREGRIANVVVYDFHKLGYKDLHLNAVEEASSRLWHVQLFKLLGILPPMLHDNPGDALMVAFGAGMSAGAAVGHVDQLEVVDLNPDIEGVAEVFARENLDVLHHPNYRKVVNDGRNALLLSPKRYSLIISDATNPKMFDSWTLYSQEFYELVARRLEPGGVFAQWVLIPLPGDSIKVTLNTFRSVFPHTSFWCIYGSSQCLMLATPERLQIDYAALVQRLEPVLGPSGLREYGVDSPEKFLSFFLLGEDHLAHLLAGHSTLNTDDLPYAQFQVEQDDNGIQASLDLVRHQEPILTYLTNSGPDLVALAARMAVYEDLSRRLHLGFLTGDATHDREAEKVAADAGLIDANVRSALHYGPEKQRYFEERVRSHPDDANAHNTLGFIRWRLGDHDGARRSFQTAIALDPAYPMARANLARLLVDMGAFDDAVTALLEVRATHPTKTVLEMTRRQLDIVHLLRRQARRPGDAAPLRDLALAYYEDGQLRRSLEALEASLAADPRDLAAWAHLGRLLEAHGFPEQAADAYRRLAKLVPGDPALRARADELDSLRDPDRRRGWMASRVALRPAPAPGDHPETCDRALAAWHASGLETRVERTDLVTAATLYEASLATRPDDLHAWVDAALLREILGDRSRAMELWRGANDIAPEWPDPGHHLRRLELLGRLEGMAAGDPERPLVLEELAAHLRALARGEEAVIYLRQAVAADPARARTWAALAAALEEVGLYDEAAAAALRSAVAASPPGQDVPTRG